MTDTCRCPHCGTVLEVSGEYGFRKRCPVCRGTIDVFPDEAIVIRHQGDTMVIEGGGLVGKLLKILV